MRMFRTLRANEIEARISEIGRNGNYVRLLLYKTARTDAALLDEAEEVGPFNWQCEYKMIDNKLYCGLGIRDKANGDWIWKWNVGTESNQEAEKGQASDALKRAGFTWGLGTELYSAPDIKIKPPACTIKQNEAGKFVCYDKFKVSAIGYDEEENINALEIINRKTGAVVFSIGTAPTAPAAPQTPTAQMITDIQRDALLKKMGRTPKLNEFSTQRFGGMDQMTKEEASALLADLNAQEARNAGN